MTMWAPSDAAGVADAIADAARAGVRVEIRGGGSKARIGAERASAVLDMRGIAGVVDYDPPELVLTVGAGTPLAEVTALVEGEGQMLAFEPWDHGPLFGEAAGAATIGGVLASGTSGSQRLSAGAARDHLLGFEGVSGRGERFKGGAKVVKNVTGYDLPKLMAGSWGRIVALTQVTLKVLPRPRTRVTLAIEGLNEVTAHAAMAAAISGPADVAAAAHLPPAVNAGRALTLIRLQGFEPSVAARCALLLGLLGEHGKAHLLETLEADRLWAGINTAALLGEESILWRINVPPSRACAVVTALEAHGAHWLFDWAGGLIWLAFDGSSALVRSAAETAGGHATLVRAPAAIRAVVPAHHPRPSGVAALEARVRHAFDPTGLFESGRFLDYPHAN